MPRDSKLTMQYGIIVRMHHKKLNARQIIIPLLLTLLLFTVGFALVVWLFTRNAEAPQTPAGDSNEVAFNMKMHSLDDPSSPWIIVNKQRPLNPLTYAPTDLVTPNVPLRTRGEEMLVRQEAATALEAMFSDAAQEGIHLILASGYRSYNFQQSLYSRYTRELGQAAADTQSARPGYSEHQTGWAIDVGATSRQCEIEQCFGTMREGQWVADNAYKYGFVIRYAQGTENVTGYIYEPWHLRYVGKPLAQEVNNQQNPTLEAFFTLPAAGSYN